MKEPERLFGNKLRLSRRSFDRAMTSPVSGRRGEKKLTKPQAVAKIIGTIVTKPGKNR